MTKTFSRFFLAGTLALAAFSTLPAAAQPAGQPLPQVNGEIRKVDAAAGKLTIRHEDIPNLDMPGMTMVFRASPSLVGQAREGDKVKFTADRVEGALTVMSLQPGG